MTQDLHNKDNLNEDTLINDKQLGEEKLSNVEVLEQETKEQEIIGLKETNQELQNKLLRSFADLENYRKRAEKNLEDNNKYAIASFAKDIIRVADNLDRALQVLTNISLDEKLIEDIKTGLTMTQKELNAIFEKHAICAINPVAGDVFDHNEHQAVAHLDVPEVNANCIASVMQVGYKVYDRLLRPAMVVVAK